MAKNYSDRDVLRVLVGPETCPTCLNPRKSVMHRELCMTDNTPAKENV